MQVVATIRFLTPSLGNCRNERRDKMLRDQSGRIIYLQSWWRSGLGYAAQALSRLEKEVAEIQADPVVEGNPEIFRRYYNANSFKEHEAFLAGSTLKARFCLPNRVSTEDFKELLTVAGKYVGISPYGYRHDFGRFEVVSVEPLHATKSSDPTLR